MSYFFQNKNFYIIILVEKMFEYLILLQEQIGIFSKIWCNNNNNYQKQEVIDW